ncbi:BrnA antitoxin family protein [Pseudoroseicyclus tamaricis]|uniref:3-oxoacyl-ACP synthase n=1 Tax=Pseudoroseicyclus tamaricis TaxID=2705421 RepID=A0A6B2JXE4_9RHOB|nr:BrnA antitoxin family protein [Pseudoroseicyclus tamaricis]NDV00944.1 3-oxoacyl-ACP synthase [Pseudoroseicyclus tamaricis]
MATKTFRLDPDNPPSLSDSAKARLDATPDDEIDYSEIPDMGDVDWQRPAPKPTVTMRLDEDVIAFFKREDPKGYTRRMASVLTAFARHRGGAD